MRPLKDVNDMTPFRGLDALYVGDLMILSVGFVQIIKHSEAVVVRVESIVVNSNGTKTLNVTNA